ncbi:MULTISPECIES: helix-turn-helix domain-containing protein [unclassified Listeria]|uniref:helix-turn-helix domain-containing protein n=1 Tax=unclassified Listeria TaxID=2642072 RepID=UPI000B58BD55|nr:MULTISPECIES: helix-turn-helix domain-containing protein [unclassified Listeria]
MFGMKDSVIKQKIVSELYEYVMSQKEVAEYLDMETTNVSKLVKDNKIVPLYVFNQNSSRKIYLFYKKDVEEYKKNLDAFRNLRNKNKSS